MTGKPRPLDNEKSTPKNTQGELPPDRLEVFIIREEFFKLKHKRLK
jgi:hypothetical protein